MKIITFFLLVCLTFLATACPVTKSTPKMPKSVRGIVDESATRTSSGNGSKENNQTFEQELYSMMNQYDCVMGVIAIPSTNVNPKNQPVVVTTKTTRKVTSNINANTTVNTNADTNSNTSSNTVSNTQKNTSSIVNSTSKKKGKTTTATENINENSNSNSNSNTDSNTTATTVSNSTAETVEEITTTSDTSVTTVTTQCGGVVIQDRMRAAKMLRDAIVQRMLRVIDYAYFQFENDLYVKRATGSFLADFIDIGGNLAGTITNGERAKTIINAAIIAFRGSRKSASIHYFQEQTADVLITKMQTARNRELAVILRQLQENVDDYPLDAALRNIIGYFFAGTLPRALQELKKDASVAAQDAEDEVRLVQNLPEQAARTKVERDQSVKSGKFLRDYRKALNSAEAKDQADATERLKDIVEELSKDDKIKVELATKNITEETEDGMTILRALILIRTEKLKVRRDPAEKEILDKINEVIIEVSERAAETEETEEEN